MTAGAPKSENEDKNVTDAKENANVCFRKLNKFHAGHSHIHTKRPESGRGHTPHITHVSRLMAHSSSDATGRRQHDREKLILEK
jgi:hypothetical protein